VTAGAQTIAVRAGLAILFLGAWELAPHAGWVDRELLPPLDEVLGMFATLLGRAAIRTDLLVTAAEVMVAFVVSVPVGALLGMVLGESPRLARIFDPLVFFLFSIPKSIFLPMFILTLGIGFWQKVAFGMFSTMLIVLLSAASAVRSVRPEHLLVARSYGATRSQIARRVYLPSMLPILLDGLRIAIIFTFTAVILAEMYASQEGIGHQIQSWGEDFQMPQLFAGVLLLALVAILCNETIRWVERRCGAWRS
jgi:NitT/TauT family transport system permease protein